MDSLLDQKIRILSITFTANHTYSHSLTASNNIKVTFNVSDDQKRFGEPVLINGETKNTDAQGKGVFIEVLTVASYTVAKKTTMQLAM